MAGRADVTVREATTAPITWQLMQGTAPLDLSTIDSLTLHLRDRSGVHSTFATAGGQLVVSEAAAGKVRFTPGSADLAAAASPYRGYFQVFVTEESWYSVPEDSEFDLVVRGAF